MKSHEVYPGGPPCQPNCPGEWSMYHDGYADGHESGESFMSGGATTPDLLEAIGRIADMTKPSSLYMDGTAAYFGSTHLTYRVHAAARAAFGETATPWAEPKP